LIDLLINACVAAVSTAVSTTLSAPALVTAVTLANPFLLTERTDLHSAGAE
jgi:hypothetical protein